MLLLAPHGVLAQGLCVAPAPPLPLNGAEASAEQLREAIANARNFIGQANLYENCLLDELKAAQDRDAQSSDLDKDTAVRIAANRRLKDKVSSDAVSAMDAYKKAHAD